jgi:hypothetical protein
MTFTMFKIKFDNSNYPKGGFFLMKLSLPEFLSVKRDGNIFLVNEAARNALEKENIWFRIESQMTFCCHDFYNFYIMGHIGKPNIPELGDQLYYLFKHNDTVFPEGRPIIYCSWCGIAIDDTGF